MGLLREEGARLQQSRLKRPLVRVGVTSIDSRCKRSIGLSLYQGYEKSGRQNGRLFLQRAALCPILVEILRKSCEGESWHRRFAMPSLTTSRGFLSSRNPTSSKCRSLHPFAQVHYKPTLLSAFYVLTESRITHPKASPRLIPTKRERRSLPMLLAHFCFSKVSCFGRLFGRRMETACFLGRLSARTVVTVFTSWT
jgi:hypothetical protein